MDLFNLQYKIKYEKLFSNKYLKLLSNSSFKNISIYSLWNFKFNDINYIKLNGEYFYIGALKKNNNLHIFYFIKIDIKNKNCCPIFLLKDLIPTENFENFDIVFKHLDEINFCSKKLNLYLIDLENKDKDIYFDILFKNLDEINFYLERQINNEILK